MLQSTHWTSASGNQRQHPAAAPAPQLRSADCHDIWQEHLAAVPAPRLENAHCILQPRHHPSTRPCTSCSGNNTHALMHFFNRKRLEQRSGWTCYVRHVTCVHCHLCSLSRQDAIWVNYLHPASNCNFVANLSYLLVHNMVSVSIASTSNLNNMKLVASKHRWLLHYTRAVFRRGAIHQIHHCTS